MAYAEATQFSDVLEAIKRTYEGTDLWTHYVSTGYNATDFIEMMKNTPGVCVLQNEAGEVRSVWCTVKETLDTASNIGSTVNSNIAPAEIAAGNTAELAIPAETAVTETGQIAATSGVTSAAGTVASVCGTVASAIGAVAGGCALGKVISKTLYDNNINIWGDDFEYADPETWSEISSVLDEEGNHVGATVWNVLFGLDPNGNKAQMYLDEKALAYTAYYMKQKGMFSQASKTVEAGIPSGFTPTTGFPATSIKVCSPSDWTCADVNSHRVFTVGNVVGTGRIECFNMLLQVANDEYASYMSLICSDKPFTADILSGGGVYMSVQGMCNTDLKKRYPNSLVYYTWLIPDMPYGAQVGTLDEIATSIGYTIDYNWFNNITTTNTTTSDKFFDDAMFMAVYGTLQVIQAGGVPGVTDQKDAKVPNLDKANNVTDVLQALKDQFPELWQKAVTNTVPQPDGKLKTFTYLPVPMPNADSATDTQPWTSTQTQTNPVTDPDASPADAIKGATDIINPTSVVPDTATPDTGTGTTPPALIPVGSANALYSIYNPTQEQLNSFGGWLWSSDFVDQILKVFSDPMQAIIGLHKVYATPDNGGVKNIKVGYLDSGVASDTVKSQYTTVDCGSVDLPEYFGNVFDYSPFTDISIYLPFVGIVPLNVADVMRSTISVVYHVDVLTGACLAEIRVKRDASGGTLYTYAGNCAVQYPVSSGSYMGIVSGLIGVAGSVASGSIVPAIAGVMNMHTSVERSGSFSGNPGAMGIKKPYLIITRPQTAMANNFETLDGYPSNYYTSLSKCSGYTKVKKMFVTDIPATDNELDEIKQLLQDGVIA